MQRFEIPISEALASALPVVVDGYSLDYADMGWINLWDSRREDQRWSLMVACASRFDAPGFSWDSEDDTSSAEVSARLLGSQLLRVDVGSNLVNPVLHFSGDQRLSVFADTDYDPWVLSLPGMPWILVGVHQDERRDDWPDKPGE